MSRDDKHGLVVMVWDSGRKLAVEIPQLDGSASGPWPDKPSLKVLQQRRDPNPAGRAHLKTRLVYCPSEFANDRGFKALAKSLGRGRRYPESDDAF